MSNIIHWVEIPTLNIERASAFYATLLNTELKIMEAMGMKTAFFPHTSTAQSGGCLMEGPMYQPSAQGSIIYLNAGEDLQTGLDKVEAAGGSIVLPKTAIGENGFMAHILDTEGNKIGLYSKK